MFKGQNISIKTKSIIAFSFIFVLVLGLSFVGFQTISHLKEGQKEITETNYESIIHLNKLNISMLSLRRHEKDFLVRKQTKYIQRHKEEIENFQNITNKLNTLNKGNSTELDKISKSMKSYSQGMENIISLINAEGNSQTGLRGNLRQIAHTLEKYFKTQNLSDFYMLNLLNLRRSEKDFLLRRDDKYKTQIDSLIRRVETRMQTRGMDEVRYKFISNKLQSFQSNFEKLVKNHQLIKQQEDIFRNDIQKLEKEIELLIKSNMQNLQRVKESLNIEASLALKTFIGATALIMFLIFAINALAYKVTSNIGLTVNNMKSLATGFLETSHNIHDSSSHLNELATTQSASIQQTASSVNEITAMVSKTADSAIQSQEKSKENALAANQGKTTVFNVIKAMNNLSSSTHEMSERFGKTSDELQDVVNIINQIGEKAEVINDIVFQTKLLSFNASVEAARAGEHGKGFAVVAEEVGNLASMSGKSAEEISRILEESIQKVNNLVETNQKEIDLLVKNNKQKVDQGIQTAKECEVALNTIINNVENINSSISEIAQASQEQDTGVKEISLAINEFNNNNQKTVNLANDSKDHSSHVKEKANEMFNISRELETLLYGNLSTVSQNKNNAITEKEKNLNNIENDKVA